MLIHTFNITLLCSLYNTIYNIVYQLILLTVNKTAVYCRLRRSSDSISYYDSLVVLRWTQCHKIIIAL